MLNHLDLNNPLRLFYHLSFNVQTKMNPLKQNSARSGIFMITFSLSLTHNVIEGSSGVRRLTVLRISNFRSGTKGVEWN